MNNLRFITIAYNKPCLIMIDSSKPIKQVKTKGLNWSFKNGVVAKTDVDVIVTAKYDGVESYIRIPEFIYERIEKIELLEDIEGMFYLYCYANRYSECSQQGYFTHRLVLSALSRSDFIRKSAEFGLDYSGDSIEIDDGDLVLGDLKANLMKLVTRKSKIGFSEDIPALSYRDVLNCIQKSIS